LAILFFLLNWSALADLVDVWDREPDYSHGYLVAPIAALFLWFRRDQFPRNSRVPGWGGFVLLAVSAGIYWLGTVYFLNPLPYWAMITWIAGVVWILAGRQVLWWALPAIAFLFFMVPLPYQSETLLSVPLQRAATYLSCWGLQLLGQPAFAEGNTIYLEMTQLEVEHACSGLRMLVMITALAAACSVLVCRNWSERLFVAICIVPVALFANSVRIVATGLAHQYLSSEASKAISHDLAGWIVVPVAAATMGLALLYWRHLFLDTDQNPLVVSRQSRYST
jgi:exosortase